MKLAMCSWPCVREVFQLSYHFWHWYFASRNRQPSDCNFFIRRRAAQRLCWNAIILYSPKNYTLTPSRLATHFTDSGVSKRHVRKSARNSNFGRPLSPRSSSRPTRTNLSRDWFMVTTGYPKLIVYWWPLSKANSTQKDRAGSSSAASQTQI